MVIRLRTSARRVARLAAAPLVLLALTLAAARAGADGLPERFDASFMLSAQGMDVAETRWRLAPAGNGHYVYTASSEAVGFAKLLRDEHIVERSEWRFSAAGGVMPLHYSYARSGGRRAREVEVRFDWKNGRVHNTLNGHSWSMDVAPGTLDKLVYLLELMRDLAEGVRETDYAVADGGRVKTYQVRVVGEERVDTVLGTLETVVVERRRSDDDRLTVVWCAPALRYLPVRVEHREDDGSVSLRLTSLEGLAP